MGPAASRRAVFAFFGGVHRGTLWGMSGANKATKKPIDRPVPEVDPKPAPAAKSGIDLELWRKSMERIQRLFESGSLRFGPLIHYLIFSPVFKDGQNCGPILGPENLPPKLPGDNLMCADCTGTLSPAAVPWPEGEPVIGWRSRCLLALLGDRRVCGTTDLGLGASRAAIPHRSGTVGRVADQCAQF